MIMCASHPPPTPLIHLGDWRLTIAGTPGFPLDQAQQKISLQRGSTQEDEEWVCSSGLPTSKCLNWWGLLCGSLADISASHAMKRQPVPCSRHEAAAGAEGRLPWAASGISRQLPWEGAVTAAWTVCT